MNILSKEIQNKIIDKTDLVLKYLVPFFYASITVAFFLKTYDSAQIKITLLQIVGTMAVGLWVIKIIAENRNPFKENIQFTAPLIIYLALAYFSYFHSDFPGTTLDELIRRNMYIILSLIIIREFNTLGKIRTLINWVLIAAFISSLYGIVQYLDYIFFPKTSDVMMNNEFLDPFIWRQAFGKRIFSTHGNPNFFGNFLVVVSPIALSMFIWKKTFNYLILFIMIAVCVFLTFSKGAYLGFAAGLFIFTVLVMSYLPISKNKTIKTIFTIGIVIVVAGSLFAIVRLSQQRIDSLRFRVFTWLSTWEMIETEPVMGTGLGTFKTTYPAYRRPQIFHIEGKSNTETDHPENEFLEVLYDDGIIGFGLFIWVLVLYTIIGLKSLKYFSSLVTTFQGPGAKSYEILEEPRAYYLLGVLSAFFGMLFHNLFDVSLRFVSSGIFLWFLIGIIGSFNINNPLLAKLPAVSTEEEKPLFRVKLDVLRWILAAAAVGISLWLIKIFWGYFMADIYHNMGIFHSKRQEWTQALDNYNKVIKNNPNYIMAHYFMGNVYNDRWLEDDYKNALQKYSDVKTLAPNYVQVHHQVGNVYVKLGDKFMNEAKQLQSAGNIARSVEKQNEALKNYQLALESYNKYWKLDPVFPPNFYRMAWVYMQLNNYPKAEEMYRAALVENPTYAETYLNLGNICYLQNKYNEAEKAYKKAIELSPGFVQAMKNLSVIYDRTGRRQEAEMIWREIARLNPNDEDLKRVFKKN